MQPCPKCGHLCHASIQRLAGLPIFITDEDDAKPIKEVDCPNCGNRESLSPEMFRIEQEIEKEDDDDESGKIGWFN